MIPLLGIAKDLGDSSPMKDSAIGGRVPVECLPKPQMWPEDVKEVMALQEFLPFPLLVHCLIDVPLSQIKLIIVNEREAWFSNTLV